MAGHKDISDGGITPRIVYDIFDHISDLPTHIHTQVKVMECVCYIKNALLFLVWFFFDGGIG